MHPSSPVSKLWKVDLFKIQLEAPQPNPIKCNTVIPNRPMFYEEDYHGEINHKRTEEILKSEVDGSYLVRKSPGSDNNFYTLSLRFDNRTKHYKIYYNNGHFLKEDFKTFETLRELVADGLVNFYMQKHAAPIIQQMMCQTTKNCYQQSPYMTLNRRKLRAISHEMRKSLKLQEIMDQNCDNNNHISVNEDEKELLIPHDDHIEIDAGSNVNNNYSPNESIQEEDQPLPEKHHEFKITNFKGFFWCELCANFLWGFTAQGVKCDHCGFIAHKKCSELVPPNCIPVLKRIRGIFGTDLTTIVSLLDTPVPFIVIKCVQEVELRGLLQEGIYRISGFADEIEALKLALDKESEHADISEAAYSNINVVAGTLKLYLRLLPIPLITFQAYSIFMETTKAGNDADMVKALRNAVLQLPTAHFNCLKFVIEHLNRVAANQHSNKMTEYNLSTVFSPTLIGLPASNLTDLSQEIFMLASLITNCNAVFS